MIDGQVKAISLAGITHNTTKIGVQDGQSEDLVNLRFKDGSWRATGDGKRVFSITDSISGHSYVQLYIHTNIYRHLLGVENGTLYWIANLSPSFDAASIEDEDFVFEPLKDKDGEPAPVALTQVTGNLTITQTGHLITVIDEADDFEFFVYKTSEDKYIEGKVDENGKQEDRRLYPFDCVHFNYSRIDLSEIKTEKEAEDAEDIIYEKGDIGIKTYKSNKDFYYLAPDKETACNYIKVALGNARKKNIFTRPFLACYAVRLYDDSFAFAGAPQLIFPFQSPESQERCLDIDGNIVDTKLYDGLSFGLYVSNVSNEFVVTKYASLYNDTKDTYDRKNVWYDGSGGIGDDGSSLQTDLPCFAAGCNVPFGEATVKWKTLVAGAKLTCSLTNADFLKQNSDIFKSLCIFITPEIDYIDWDSIYVVEGSGNGIPLFFKNKQMSSILHDLVRSNFYLLKEYGVNEIEKLVNNPVVDLSEKEDEGVLESICNSTVSDFLKTESFSRMSYSPMYSYSYNGRLHIANYKSHQFHGYPLDCFHLNNHSVKYEDNATFKFGQLKNLADNNDKYLQWERNDISLFEDSQLTAEGAPVAIAKVYVETDDGVQEVSRYIKSGDTNPTDKLEDLDPLLTFPDYRATKMEIYYVEGPYMTGYKVRKRVFELKPHPYLNIAYYIEPDLKPIKWSSFGVVANTNELIDDVGNIIEGGYIKP